MEALFNIAIELQIKLASRVSMIGQHRLGAPRFRSIVSHGSRKNGEALVSLGPLRVQ